MSTEQNLKTAFAGESQANRKYTAFAKKADAEGWPQIAKLFRAAAEAETVHALREFRALGGVKSTVENLQSAIDGEGYEVKSMYPPMIAEAKAEGNKAAESAFDDAWDVEKVHHGLYTAALASLTAGKDLAAAPIHVCPVCGNTFQGDVPDMCPVCSTKKEKFFEVK